MARIDVGMDGIELGAQTGTPDALFELGMLYATGLDVEADLVVAHKWFNLAAMRGNSAALVRRKELALEMTPAQIAEAQRLAREWLATEKVAAERRTTELAAIGAFALERAAASDQAGPVPAPERILAERSNVVWLTAKPLAA
jgi:TPR repeat protein